VPRVMHFGIFVEERRRGSSEAAALQDAVDDRLIHHAEIITIEGERPPTGGRADPESFARQTDFVIAVVSSKSRTSPSSATVKTVIVARPIIGLRAAAFLTAGIAGVPFGLFVAANCGAALVGVTVIFGLAYLFY
jgi:hypothetical protein